MSLMTRKRHTMTYDESPEEKDASYQWFDIRDRELTECRIRICERIQALEKIST